MTADGKIRPRSEWPDWLRYAMAEEQRRRRKEIAWDAHTVAPLDDE